MKKSFILFIFSILITCNTYSQDVATSSVVYGVFPSMNIKTEDTDVQQLFRETEKAMKNVRMVLYYNEDKSLFLPNAELQVDKGAYFHQMALAMAGVKNKIWYSSISQDEVIMKYNFMGKDYLVKSNTQPIKLELINEKKMIETYTAYKALYSKLILGSRGSKIVEYEIWYVPSLNSPFGPLGIVGLPGLVVEVNFANISIKAIEISEAPKNFKLKKPNEGVEILDDDFFKLSSQMVSKYRDKIRN